MLDLMLLLNVLTRSLFWRAQVRAFDRVKYSSRLGTKLANKYVEAIREKQREGDAYSENDLAKNDEYQANWI